MHPLWNVGQWYFVWKVVLVVNLNLIVAIAPDGADCAHALAALGFGRGQQGLGCRPEGAVAHLPHSSA